MGRLSSYVFSGLAALALCGQPARADYLTAGLTCVLAGANLVACDATSYGTVTLDDSVGGGQIMLTVDVRGIAGKFRDLMLNFDAGSSGITSVSSGDGQAALVSAGFMLVPYFGLFGMGGTGQQGWSSDTALYTTQLTGNGILTLDMFNVTDSLGNLNVALHLQDLVIGDSIKVGGAWDGGQPPSEIPEPVTAALLGGGLTALACLLRGRKASQPFRPVKPATWTR